MNRRYDAVVIGGGPGGAVASYFLRQHGLSVLMLERTPFPRYRIGESLTGVTGDFIRELGLVEKMGEHRFPPKSGVKVLGREAKNEFFIPVPRPTWQVLRSAFDGIVLERAQEAGAELRHGTVTAVLRDGDRITGVRYRVFESDEELEIECRAVIDASGHSAVLSKLGLAGRRRVDAFGRQIAVFSQYHRPIRDPGAMGDNTFIFYSKQYHWAWFIPLSPDVVSVGVVMPVTTYKERGDSPEAVLQWGLENVNPDLSRRVRDARQVEQVRFIRNYSYRIEPFAGNGWFCVGDAHRFTDPIFSFGVSLTMLEAKAAAAAVAEGLRTGDFREPVANYVAYSDVGQNAIYDFIRYFWKYPAFFGIQSQGRMRKSIISLFAVECHNEEVQLMLKEMRRSLYTMQAEQLPGERLRAIGERALARFTDFQGIDAIYVAERDTGIHLSFYLDESTDDVRESLADFERELDADFGKDRVITAKWPATAPRDTAASAIFDRRTLRVS
ncbi:tryptophan 7-halogenase [Pendulispora brunnea]|uniref:Tryptophan 7-halogenase n=1 Tax=Pendulispora brunnea TaxID=2905690 RepID=A0ABZ2KB02_9BACT